jgi:hypothetical protein
METFVAMCKKIKSGEPNGWVYGEFNRLTIRYYLASYFKAKENGIKLI